MPVVSAEPIEKSIYRLTIVFGHGDTKNVVASSDGIYNVRYIKNGKCTTNTGRIINVVNNLNIPKNSYVLFDWSEDKSGARERVYFYQVITIDDVTPNDAYRLAIQHGFVGTYDDWMASMHGEPGKDAYEIAIDCGFVGSREEWLESLRGPAGKSAYELAVEHGFTGTEDDWFAKNGDTVIVNKKVNKIQTTLKWVEGMVVPQA